VYREGISLSRAGSLWRSAGLAAVVLEFVQITRPTCSTLLRNIWITKYLSLTDSLQNLRIITPRQNIVIDFTTAVFRD
jgi:hypothetical protein